MTEAVFPDWSPYLDLGAAARAYLRDPDVALDCLGRALKGAGVLGFTLERFVNEYDGVWQEVAVPWKKPASRMGCGTTRCGSARR